MGQAVFLFYVVIFSYLTIKHMSYALLALICMFALEQWGTVYIPFVAENGRLVNIGIISLAIISWFRLPAGTSFEFLLYPVRMAIIILFIYALISTAWAPSEVKSMSRFLSEIHYMLIMIFVAPLLIRKSEDVTKVLDALTLYGGILLVLFAYVPEFSGRALVVANDLDATVALPLTLADFAAIVMVVSITRLKTNPLEILWVLFVCASAILLMAKTGSRGQLIFGLAATLICLPVRWRRFTINKFIIYAALGLVISAAFLIVVNTENTLSARINNENYTGIEHRIFMVTKVLTAWGEGSITTLIFGLGSSASWSQSIAGFYPHNIPVEVLGELGIVGFTILLFIVASLSVKAYSRELRASLTDTAARDFAALYGCWILAFLVSNKQGAFIDSPEIILYAVLSEKCLRVGQRNLSYKKHKRRIGNKKRRHKIRQTSLHS